MIWITEKTFVSKVDSMSASETSMAGTVQSIEGE